ncbi:MAG: hypothetical protein AAFO28_06555 [Pseudomonadota bacterium]
MIKDLFASLRLDARLLALLALCLPALAVPGALAAQDTPGARAFARDAIALFSEALPEATYTSEPGDPLQINITEHPEFDSGTINLHRVYNLCQSISAQECDGEIANLVAELTRQPAQPSAADLRIIVRDAQYWGYVSEIDPSERPPHRQIGEDLYAILALDSPVSISLAMPSMLEGFGISQSEAWAKGLAQTEANIPTIPVSEAESLLEGLVALAGEEYVGIALVDLERWGKIAERVGPELIVAVTSDQLVLAGLVPQGPELSDVKAFVIEDCNVAPRCISPNVYRFRDGRWVIAR